MMRNFFALLTSLLLHLLLAWGAVRLLQTPPEAPPPYREIDLEILALPAEVAQPIKSDEEALSSPAPVKAPEREPIKEEAREKPEETKVEPEEVKEAPKEAAPRPDKPTPKAKPKEKPKPKEEKPKDKPKKEKPAVTPKPKKSKEPRPEPKPREEPREPRLRDQRERAPVEVPPRPNPQPHPPAPTRVPPGTYSGNRPANSFSNRPPANFSNAPPGNRPAAAPANPANGRPAPPPKAAPKPDGNALKSYQNGLRRAIERHKPRNARSKGLVVVAFQVSGSGALTNVRIAQSSGNEALDRAALGAVQNTGSYEPPPGGQGFGVQLPIRFD